MHFVSLARGMFQYSLTKTPWGHLVIFQREYSGVNTHTHTHIYIYTLVDFLNVKQSFKTLKIEVSSILLYVNWKLAIRHFVEACRLHYQAEGIGDNYLRYFPVYYETLWLRIQTYFTFNHQRCGNPKVLKVKFLKFIAVYKLKTQLSSAKTVQLWLNTASGFTLGYLKTLSQLQFLFSSYVLR